ncbi:MAG: hypothetical protein V7754_20345 [Halioglobus sp.]
MKNLFLLPMITGEDKEWPRNNYNRWWGIRAFLFSGAQKEVGEMVATFKDFPPRQKAASFNVEDAIQGLAEPSSN